MTRRSYFLPLLAALIIVPDILLAYSPGVMQDAPGPVPLLTTTFLLSQAGLLGIWAGLSRTRWFIRLPVAFLGLAELMHLLDEYNYYSVWPYTLPALIEAVIEFQAYTAVAVLIVFRILGLDLQKEAVGQPAGELVTNRTRPRFSSASLLCAGTAIAFFLGLGGTLKTVVLHRSALYETQYWTFAILGIFLGVLALIPTGLILSSTRPLRYFLLAIVGAVILGLAMYWIVGEDVFQSGSSQLSVLRVPPKNVDWHISGKASRWSFHYTFGSGELFKLVGPNRGGLASLACIAFLHAVFVGGVLLVFRISGYRLAWRETVDPADLRRALADVFVGRPVEFFRWYRRALLWLEQRRGARHLRFILAAFWGFLLGFLNAAIIVGAFQDISGDRDAELRGFILAMVGGLAGSAYGAVYGAPREPEGAVAGSELLLKKSLLS